MAESAKLDPGLMLALHDYERQSRKSEPDKTISVILEFRGEFAPLAALGFAPATVMGSEAIGTVRFADLSRLAAHPDVLRISAGQRRRLSLDTSVRDIHARAPTVADIGTKGLWHADVATGTLTSTGGATGKDVIIAMIDSGIDVSHPMFNKAISPKYDSRIIRIWDQGLRPQAGEAGPPANLLLSAVTYGVEYKTKDINDALDDSLFPLLPLDFPHRDCEGHGTHVASIAAGGSTFAPSTDAARVGVAPEADIIMVKVFDTPDDIRDANNNVVSADVRVRDAVIYCLRTAKSLNKPIVISCSFGNSVEAGDGLDAESRWFHQTFDPARAADDNHFPNGAILVKAAGNEGDVTDRSYARITVPDSREIVVPFELYDTRGSNRTHIENCFRKANVPALRVSLWYRDVPAPQDVSIAARVPTETTFSNEVFANFLSKDFDGGKTRIISHDALPPVQRPDGAGGTVAVRRNSAQLILRPTPRTSPPQHALGIYDIRIRAPAGTVVFAACDQGAGFGFQVATAYRDASLLPAPEIIAGSAAPITPIDVTAAGTIDADMITPHIISVAAYDDANGLTANANYKALPAFSSRGPIRDYSNPPLGPLTDKPDIAAPGVLISAALSKDTDTNLVHFSDYAFMQGNRFDAYTGTSMAAPAIAGVVALMLQKKNDLSVSDVRDKLTALANVNPGLHPAVGDPGYSEGFGAGLVDALKSHAAVS